ncbi:MAG: DUF1611 domain-containing protein [Cyanobacteria bacterium P01_A01_bin.135]
MLKPNDRLAILLHGGLQSGSGKTGLSLLRYGDRPVVAVIDQDCPGGSVPKLTGIDRQVPVVASVTEALALEPTVLAIGIAPSGGALPEPWLQEVRQAVVAGLSVVNGLHTPMEPMFAPLLQPGQWVWDVRREPEGLAIGGGRARHLDCRRVLTVGTDMGIGKMSTCLELHSASVKRGLRSKFVATGQTGLMLGHDGVALDAVRIDFAAGAVEGQVMRWGPENDILYIEGQGSLVHPGSTATLPLMRGSQPTHLVLVHRVGRTHINHFPEFALPTLPEAVYLYEAVAAASPSFSGAKVAAIALNTWGLDEAAAQAAIAQASQETGLPCSDVVRFGGETLLEAILS